VLRPHDFEQLHQFFVIVAFTFGAVVGSFANVCISRWPLGLSVVRPPSRCPQCKTYIAWYDNIPILSWLMLRAKCRECGLPIHWQYPLVEFITGVLFLCVYLRFGYSVASPIYMVFCAGLVIVTVQDIIDWTIPDEISIPGIPLGIGVAALAWWVPDTGLRVERIWDAVAGAALGGGIILGMDRLTVWVLKKPGMGFGDVKLLAMLGAFLGWQGAVGTLLAGSWFALIIGGPFVFLAPKFMPAKNDDDSDGEAADENVEGDQTDAAAVDPIPEPDVRPSEYDSDDGITVEGHYLPFGPFLVCGALFFLFFGPEFVAWYLEFSSQNSGLISGYLFESS
jgi:leader peptidase (prepilin peptidase)/N-methyltransferase